MDEIFNNIKKFNFWDGKPKEFGFLREQYLEQIKKFIHNPLIKLIIGQRRVGKSYLLRQIALYLIKSGTPGRNILYINKEFVEFDEITDYKQLDKFIKHYKAKLKPKGRVFLFIDEVQNIDQWERLINSYSQNFTEQYEVFISGSNSKMLAGELSSLLSGRYVKFHVLPFSYTEFLKFYNLKLCRESYVSYLNSSGLPGLFILNDELSKRQYISSLKDTILLRDIIQRNNIREPKLLEDIFTYLLNTSSNLVSLNNITNYFKSKGRKISYDTIASYVGFIEDTFIVHKAERFDIRGKDIIGGNAKFYCNDLAFVNYLYTGFNNGIGYKLENLVYIELLRFGYQVFVGSLPNKEVDFVAKKEDKILYIQVAYSIADENTLEREYSVFNLINDGYEKWVITLDEFKLPARRGIKHIQAWNFPKFLDSFETFS